MNVGAEDVKGVATFLLRALNRAGMLNSSTLFLLFAIAVWLIAASPASAQVGQYNPHPNLARGLGESRITEQYEWDSVNLFNGNLNISIPLGISYPIAGAFGYQFALNYNSNVWDMDQPASTVTANPLKHSNAGLGWDISFGRLLPPAINGSQVGPWIYVGPDGALHPFYSTLHYDLSENDPGELASYTRDGTYCRMKVLSATQRMVESPDGTQRLFQLINGEWKLVQIGDRFNGRLWFTYSTPNLWTMSDNHGRVHKIYFKADPSGYYPAIVDRMELAAFNGTIATYTFAYTTASVTRPAIDNDPATSATVTLPLLSSITAPDGSQHVFTYHAAGAAADSSGRLASMRLPTMGKLEYTYQYYNYTSGINPTTLVPVLRKNTGLASRRMINISGGVDGVWTYTPALKPLGSDEEREMSNTVMTPLGDKTVHYFSVNTTAQGAEWNKSDYALPFTKNEFDRPRNPTVNVALASSGATATASNTLNASYPPSAAINGDRKGLNWGNGGVWVDGSVNWFPDALEVSFSSAKNIDRINVFTLQDDPANPVEPTPEMTFTQDGIKDFDVQYWNGSAWITVPGGGVVGNDKVCRQFVFSPIATSKIRVLVNKANMSSRIVEVEAFESALPADTRFLSKQVFDCDGAGNNCQLLRSTYVRYEQDHATDPASTDVASANRREVSSRVVYHDDVENGVARFADSDSSDFDGLGHFRQLKTNGNFGSGDVRTTFQNYDAATGSYPSANYVMPAPTSAWILNTTSLQKITEGTSAQVIEFCYDRNNGFLKRMRRWASAFPTGTASVKDVLVVYTSDASGQIVKEQYYGGDVQAIGTGSLCALAVPAVDQYQIQHAYQYGVRSTSQFYTASGAPFGPKFLDLTINRNIGMPIVSRDAAGIATSYDYDAMGRQTWIKPEVGQGAWKQFVYTTATATVYAKKFTYDKSNGGGSLLAYNGEVYDSFGRVTWEQTLMPDGSYPNRYTHYNALGLVRYESEFTTGELKYTEYLNYDPFGRPRTVRPLDGAQHDVTYQYRGEGNVIRTAQVGRVYYAATGQVIEGPKSRVQIFDRQGRLWKEMSQIVEGSPEFVKVNSYNAAGRLIQSVDGNGAIIGSRQDYDGRGFLFAITNPGGYNVYFNSFDALGNALKQRHTPTELTYAYDRAGRVTSVNETNNPAKVWKEFTYADSNAPNDWRAGKLWTAKRYNYMNNWGPVGGVAIVTETYTYGGIKGRVSNYDVSLSDSSGLREQFSQSYTYTELGDIEQISYPNSTFAGSGDMGRVRAAISNYSSGRLSSVTGTFNSQSQPWAASISYHSNGLVSQVMHSNGVTDNFATDPNGFTRVSQVFTTGVQKPGSQPDQNFYSGDFQYDGNQNLVRVGTQYFIPQDGQQPPPPLDPSSFTPPCQSGWTDPFGIQYALAPDGSCYPMMLVYYTASDNLFKIEDRLDNKKTWFFYDESGRKLTEYNVANSGGAWISTRDYIYRGNTLLAIEDVLKDVATPKTYHFHIGFGIPGIQTDANGFKTTPVN